MYSKYFKRMFDLVIAAIALPIWLIILLIVGLAIYLFDVGPVFYNANRLGKNGIVFKMYKFRTMKVNSPDVRNEDGSTFNAVNDPRLTRIGKFLRKTSIDETPQLLNVIKGDMSIVGPRPDLPEHLNYYVDEEKRKLNTLPGITGYNQAYFRNSVDWKDKLKHDVFYVDNVSFRLDAKILLKTIESLIFRKGIYMSSQSVKAKGDSNDT